MGLFKSILEMAVKAASDAINKKVNEGQQTGTSYSQGTSKSRSYRGNQDSVVTDWFGYFSDIIRQEFPLYSVRTNVPVTDLTGNAQDDFKLYETRPLQTYRAEWGQPYTFVLYRSGSPAGVVMLGSGNSHSRNVKFLIARMYAKKLGLPYINFYTQMPNERHYVIERIRSLLIA